MKKIPSTKDQNFFGRVQDPTLLTFCSGEVYPRLGRAGTRPAPTVTGANAPVLYDGRRGFGGRAPGAPVVAEFISALRVLNLEFRNWICLGFRA